MPRKAELPGLELECMKVFWDGSVEMSVRDVRDRLHAHRPLAYTTVMTLLDRLARKGAVSRRKLGRAHLYQAVFTRAAAREMAVARLLENFFGGSRESLLEHLSPDTLRNAVTASEEAAELDTALL